MCGWICDYSDKLAHVQVVFNCQYSVAQMCTCENGLANILGAPSIDDVMSITHSQHITFVHEIRKYRIQMARKRSIPKECPHIKILTLFVILIKSCYKDFFIFFCRERIVHLLAVRPYKKPELLSRIVRGKLEHFYKNKLDRFLQE